MTICMSELGIAEAKRDEERAAQRADYRRWLQSLSPEQRAQEYALEQARIHAAGHALMGMGIGGPMFRMPAAPPPSVPAPSYQYQPSPPPPRQLNCTYNTVGTSVHQTCY
jgi:hypothetical protein